VLLSSLKCPENKIQLSDEKIESERDLTGVTSTGGTTHTPVCQWTTW